jgi:branched-subunit amino acid transport protein
MVEVIAIVLAGVVTYVTRVLFLFSKKVRPPKRVLRYLPLVGPAVLGAIALPGLVAPQGEISVLETLPALVAAVVAAVLFRLTKQLVIGLVAGLAVWWGLMFVLAQFG